MKNLRLQYDTDFFKKIEEEAEFTPEDIQSIRQDEKNFLEDKSLKYNETEINGFMEKINIQFETFALIFESRHSYGLCVLFHQQCPVLYRQ